MCVRNVNEKYNPVKNSSHYSKSYSLPFGVKYNLMILRYISNEVLYGVPKSR